MQIPVLHFSNSDVRGGAEEHILTLLRGFDRRQFRLHLVCRPVVAGLLMGDVPGDVEVIPMDFGEPFHARAALRLASIVRNRGIQILHSHLFRASLCASPIGRFCGVPVIIETPHVREKWRKGWKASFWIDRLAGRFVDNYIAVSSANARSLVEEKGLPVRKIKTILNGCDLERFRSNHVPPIGLRASLGFGADDPVLIVAGRLEPQKGHAVLFEAMPGILSEFPQARLVCVGTGYLENELRAQVEALHIADAVRFVGFQSKVQDWLALGDISVLPSHYEGLPLIAIESLASNRPVVATAVDGTPEVVVDGCTGFTVPPNDPPSLGAAVCRLLRDPGLRSRFARNGRQWVLDHFTQRRQIEQTQDLYLRALSRKHVDSRVAETATTVQ